MGAPDRSGALSFLRTVSFGSLCSTTRAQDLLACVHARLTRGMVEASVLDDSLGMHVARLADGDALEHEK